MSTLNTRINDSTILTNYHMKDTRIASIRTQTNACMPLILMRYSKKVFTENLTLT